MLTIPLPIDIRPVSVRKLLFLLLIFTTSLSHAQTAPPKKVDLSKALHFVYYYDGYLHVELGEPYKLPDDILTQQYKNLLENDHDYTNIDIGIKTKSLMIKNGYPVGKRFQIYIPSSKEFIESELESYGLTPSGDGGVVGISGNFSLSKNISKSPLFKNNPSPFGVEWWNDRRPIGIGWWIDSGLTTDSIKANKFVVRPVDKTQLQQITKKVTDSTIVSTSCTNTANGEICAVIAEYQQPHYRKVQFYKYVNGKINNIIIYMPFNEHLHVIHDYEGEKDGTQYDGDFYFLPDLDQNGYPELFFQNTVSSIGSIIEEKDTGAIKIISLNESYRGP